MPAEIKHIATVRDYTDYFGLEKTNPQVGIIDATKATYWPEEFHLTFDVYAVLLMGSHCGEVRYGKQGKYDFNDGTIVTYAPGQSIAVQVLPGERPSARGILFSPEYIRGTSLGQNIKNFSFFSYAVSEALYVNEEERQLFFTNLERINSELAKPADDFSRNIVCLNIELLLNHCLRFYARQFETRREPDHDVFIKFEKLLNEYFNSDLPGKIGLPTVKYFADNVFLSPNYFGDLIKTQTGQNARDYIQKVIINTAKDKLVSAHEPITTIADSMGFQTTQHFSTMFKKATGMTPLAYRQAAESI